MKILLSFLFFLLVTKVAFLQTVLVSGELIQTYTAAQMSSVQAENDVAVYKILYKSNDIYGNLDTLSGALAIPTNTNCDNFPLVNYNHGTVFEKADVPSNLQEIMAGQLYGGKGYVVTLPDYLGLGEGRGIHPYQHAESEAWATVDMIRASREFLASEGISLNGEVFLTGYSQGGHATMATHKYIQENNLYSEFNVIASTPLSGAYDMSVTTANVIFATTYTNPAYIVYLINSMNMAHGPLYSNVDEYFKQPYANDVQDWLDGSLSLATINSTFPDSIHLYLQDSVVYGFQNNPNHPLKLAIAQNDVYKWAPNSLLKMYYCTADEQVPYQNALVALDTMQAYGSTNVSVFNGGNYTHGGCVYPAFLNSFGFIDGIATACEMELGVAGVKTPDFKVYPNPANDIVVIESTQKGNNIVMYDALGQVVYSTKMTTNKLSVNTQRFVSGVYFVNVKNDASSQTIKLIIK